MFLSLFVASFFLALAISLTLAWLFTKPVEDFLHRFVVDPMICAAWSKYIRFAIVVVGVGTGTRAGAFQEYLSAPSWSKAELAAQLTQNFWALGLYRTVVSTLMGLAWLLPAFCLMTLIARMFIQRAQMKELRILRKEASVQGSAGTTTTKR
jgi:hypothetical protein